MRLNIDRLNINVNGNPSTGFSGSDAVLDEIASLIGGALPNSYIELMRAADGGHPEIGCFHRKGDESPGDNLFDIDWIYSIENPDVEGVREAIAAWGPTLGPRALPFGRDGGGNQIYIDLDSSGSAVWLYLHDEEGKKLLISDTLEQFIDGLMLDPDLI